MEKPLRLENEIGRLPVRSSPAAWHGSSRRTVITTFGRDFATASTLFPVPPCRQKPVASAILGSLVDGCTFVAAHVSVIEAP